MKMSRKAHTQRSKAIPHKEGVRIVSTKFPSEEPIAEVNFTGFARLFAKYDKNIVSKTCVKSLGGLCAVLP